MAKPVAIPNTFATQFGDVPASQLDNDYTALANAINDLMTYANFAADSGSANTYIVNFNAALSVSYSNGLQIIFLASNSNTGAATLNVNSLGAVPLLRPDGSTLQAGDIVSGKIYTVTYNTNGYFQFPFSQVPTTVSFLGIVVISSTETGPGIDNYNRIQSALDQAGVFAVMLQGPGPFRVSQGLSFNRPALRLYSESEGVTSSFCTTIQYIGIATANPVVSIAQGIAGCAIQGITIDANALAGISFQIKVNDGSSTHHPKMHDILVKGYTTYGIVIGKTSTTVLGTGQLDMLDMQRIYLGGGSAGAIGLLLNAQNCEFAHVKGLYASPFDYAGNAHLNHIFAFAGGLNVQGLVTTSASSYALVTNGSQIVINGWRTEDRYAFRANPVGLEGPCFLSGVLIRGSTTLPGDLAIDFSASGTSTLFLQSVYSNGSVNIGNSAALGIDCAVTFTAGGADFVLPGPQQWFGRLVNLATGVITIRGSESLTSDLSVSGNLSVTNAFSPGHPVPISAHTGGGQGSATLIGGTNTTVTVAGTTGDSVKMPTSTGSGRWLFLNCDNVTAATIDVFPQSGQALNNLGIDVAFTMSKNTSNLWMDKAAGLWVNV